MKPVFQALFGLIVIATIGAVILSLSLDSTVRSEVKTTTAEMLDTNVDVEDVSISLLDGKGTIHGVTIHNPSGFSDKPALELQEIGLEVDVYSLFSDSVIIKKIHIKKPKLFFEQKMKGNNFDALNSKMGSSSGSETNIIVDQLFIEDGKVTMITDIGGKKNTEASFSQISVEGIGRDGNNALEQTIRQVLEPMLKKAAQQAIKEGIESKAKDAIKDVLDG